MRKRLGTIESASLIFFLDYKSDHEISRVNMLLFPRELLDIMSCNAMLRMDEKKEEEREPAMPIIAASR